MSLWKWTAAAVLALLSAAPSYAQWPRHYWGPNNYRPYSNRWYNPYPQNNQYQPPPPPPVPSYQPPPPPGPGQGTGTVWVYGSRNDGSFQDMGNGQWVETNPSAQFYYTEVGRGNGFVDLYDPNRQIYVRIQGTQLYSRSASQPNWDVGYSGHWAQ